MSGGHSDYCGEKVRRLLGELGEDAFVTERWPSLARALSGIGECVYEAEHAIDWDISGDALIDATDDDFQLKALGSLLVVILKELPDVHFDKGKWATIQAWQARTGCG